MSDKSISSKKIINTLNKTFGYWKSYGTVALLIKLLQSIQDGKLKNIGSNTEVLSTYSFTLHQKYGNEAPPPAKKTIRINWIIPPFGFGSGGHLNIFRFINFLEKKGFDCRVVIVGSPAPQTAEIAKRQINDWFFELQGNVYIGMDNAPPCDICMATSWQTAYFARNFLSTINYCYFVQDFEPYFYAKGSEYALAEATYQFGFKGITAGSWLAEKLAKNYGMNTNWVGFSYDRKLYSPGLRLPTNGRKVFFYARPPTQRRGFELGVLALTELTRRLPDITVVFAGWDTSAYNLPFRHQNSGVLSLDSLADLYRQCDVALVLSFTNLSLLPLELMACGVPVVSNTGKNNEWLLNNENSKLADPSVHGLAQALYEVLTDIELQKKLSENGLRTANQTDWDTEGEKMVKLLKQIHFNGTVSGD